MSETNGSHEYETVIKAPVGEVWHVLAERFDHIDDWGSGIPNSWVADVSDEAGAPVPGRVCQSSIAGFGDVTETIIDYGEDPYFFTYEASGMPGWMGAAMNTWHAEPVDKTTTRVFFEPEIRPAGLLGRIMIPLFMLMGRRLARETLDDLRVYLETGRPSARKEKKSARRRARAS